MTQIKEQIKTLFSEKELSDEEIINLSGAELKTGDQDAHRNGWVWPQNKEVKAMQNEIQKNIQRTNSEEKETRTQINGLHQKEETRIQKK